MKARVYYENGGYYPQVRVGWGIFKQWNHLFKLGCNWYANFDTSEEAIKFAEEFIKKNIDNGKIVWKNY